MRKTILFIILFPLFLFQCSPVRAAEFMGVTVAPEHTGSPVYKRSLYRHWVDADADSEDTRVEVLIAESLILPEITENSRGKRHVTSGLWVGKYTGFVTTNPKQIDIDHLVPLKEVHRSGGWAWSAAKRKAYANDLADPRTLIAVYASANRSKGAQDPASWMPPNRSYWCQYLNDWVAVKVKWSLSMDASERDAIQTGLRVCGNYLIRDKIGGLGG